MFHHHHHHDHDHGHDHGDTPDAALHGHDAMPRRRPRIGVALRFGIAALVLAAFVATTCLVLVGPGESVVMTRFGDPVRVITRPGLTWRLPAPIDRVTRVDMRLRTTSTGLQDVGTRDGLRVLVQAYVAWQVPADAAQVTQFLRAVRNQPDEAAEQLRSFLRSALEITASSFDLASLVNTDPSKVRLSVFEDRLRERLASQILSSYGIILRQVGIESLTLPAEALTATVARMRAERQTVATERLAEGERLAAGIRAAADRDARVTVAQAHEEAAAIEARARVEAASVAGRAFAEDPGLYVMLRSFDALDAVVGQNTRLVLRTDALPFRVLVDGAGEMSGGGVPRTPSSPERLLQEHAPAEKAPQDRGPQEKGPGGQTLQGQALHGEVPRGEVPRGDAPHEDARHADTSHDGAVREGALHGASQPQSAPQAPIPVSPLRAEGPTPAAAGPSQTQTVLGRAPGDPPQPQSAPTPLGPAVDGPSIQDAAPTPVSPLREEGPTPAAGPGPSQTQTVLGRSPGDPPQPQSAPAPLGPAVGGQPIQDAAPPPVSPLREAVPTPAAPGPARTQTVRGRSPGDPPQPQSAPTPPEHQAEPLGGPPADARTTGAMR